MTELECLLKEYGNAWIMIAFDPVNKVVMAFVVGKRNQKEIDLLIRTVKERTDSSTPHFTSDELDLYEKAILRVYPTFRSNLLIIEYFSC